MGIKLVAIGSRLMGDDGVAIYIAEQLEKIIDSMKFQIIIGETDYEYCLDTVEEEDTLIVMDSCKLGGEPGEVRKLAYEEYAEHYRNPCTSQHEASFLSQLSFYHAAKNITILAIEAGEIFEGFGFSEAMKQKLPAAFEEVLLQLGVFSDNEKNPTEIEI